MNNKLKLILFVGLLVLATGSVFLSACSVLPSQDDSRITKLESELKANGEAIAKLQQQVQEQKLRTDALTPAYTITTPPATAAAPVTPPVSKTPANTGLLASSSVVLDKLTISPAQANIGQVVTLSIEVKNTSNLAGSYNVVLSETAVPKVTSAVLEYASKVALNPGETKTVTFTATKDSAGVFSVQVGAKVGGYTVIDPNAPPTSSE
ncbi:MAG: hypothetical protein AABZ77_05235 [Chloroflexota bacterium]